MCMHAARSSVSSSTAKDLEYRTSRSIILEAPLERSWPNSTWWKVDDDKNASPTRLQMPAAELLVVCCSKGLPRGASVAANALLVLAAHLGVAGVEASAKSCDMCYLNEARCTSETHVSLQVHRDVARSQKWLACRANLSVVSAYLPACLNMHTRLPASPGLRLYQ